MKTVLTITFSLENKRIFNNRPQPLPQAYPRLPQPSPPSAITPIEPNPWPPLTRLPKTSPWSTSPSARCRPQHERGRKRPIPEETGQRTQRRSDDRAKPAGCTMERKHPSLANVAVTERFMSMITSHSGVLPEQSPFHPMKTEPLSALAVSVTDTPCW